ncbi:MAG: helix-turn-helix transcriptional regulator [Flavonifractor sp.]|jgi:transcriptional regulator with XRE-family HTH domain|nr:helix-turn-helix transcriptional regulator [Flavonifractor sp.]MCI9424517.1 helix-turn-helix transcriptional regulator [Flavonifractor sp.]MCI9473232.1 helix-turn-helix transcriptional regulator [Flavonifractor sp.]
MNVDYSAIGQRIKRSRRARGMTQEHLAEALTVSVGYISQIERGVTKISLDTLAAVATRLECELAELVTGVAVSQEHYLDRELAQLVHRMDGQQRHLLYEMARLILKNVRPLEEASG